MRNLKSSGRIRRKNQELILAAAEKEFLEFGFKGASIMRIAERAKLPRANIHYYFENKEAIYKAILSEIISKWNNGFDEATVDDDPKRVLANYIRNKILYSKTNADSSRIFASEIVHGAPHLREYLQTDAKAWVDAKVKLIQAWIDAGKMDPIDPFNLLFFIWGASQHFADFGFQVKVLSGKEHLTDRDYQQVVDDLTAIVLKGCGIS